MRWKRWKTGPNFERGRKEGSGSKGGTVRDRGGGGSGQGVGIAPSLGSCPPDFRAVPSPLPAEAVPSPLLTHRPGSRS